MEKGKTDQLKALKLQFSACVKGCDFDDFECPRSKKGITKAPEELASALKAIIKAIATQQQQKNLKSFLLTQKNLPIIGTLSKDVTNAESNLSAMKNGLEERSNARINNQETSDECDKFSNLQSQIVPELKVDLRIDMMFNFCDNEQHGDTKMCSQGKMKIMSNGTNLLKESSGFHKKGDCLASWDVSVSSVVSLPFLLCNKQEVHSCRVEIG